MGDNRPILSKVTKVSEFQNFYWTKKELIEFCRQHSIPAIGGKLEIAERIAFFLSSGGQIKPAIKIAKKQNLDSDAVITPKTLVLNYKNNAPTRDFFVSQVGEQFKFNDYLRAFARQDNDGSLTYGDLVQGYKASLETKQSTIGKQFEYNQFQRDFYLNDAHKTRDACAKAWKLVKSSPGGSTYQDYLQLIK